MAYYALLPALAMTSICFPRKSAMPLSVGIPLESKASLLLIFGFLGVGFRVGGPFFIVGLFVGLFVGLRVGLFGTLEQIKNSHTSAQKEKKKNEKCTMKMYRHSLAFPTRWPSRTAPGTVADLSKLVASPAKKIRPF